MDSFDESLNAHLSLLYREGKRLVEHKAFALFLDLVKGVRRIAWVFYLSIVSFVLLAAGVFLVVAETISQFQSTGGIYLDPVNAIGLLMSLLMFFLTAWLLSEKRWVSAFQLPSISKATTVQVDRQELAELIDELLERRVKAMSKQGSFLRE